MANNATYHVMKFKWLSKLFNRQGKEPFICVGIVTGAMDRAEMGGLGGMDYATYALLESKSGQRKVQMSTSAPVKPEQFDVYTREIIKWQYGLKRLEDIEAYLEMKTDAPRKLGYDLLGTYNATATVAGSGKESRIQYNLYENPETNHRRITVTMSSPIKYQSLNFYKNFAQRWLDGQLRNEDIKHLLDGNTPGQQNAGNTKPTVISEDNNLIRVDFGNKGPK